MLVCIGLLVECVMLGSVTIIQQNILFPAERTNYFDVSKITNCAWPRSNKRIMAHLKILCQRSFSQTEWEFKNVEKKSTWIFLNELNKRLELFCVTQNHIHREIWAISCEIATRHYKCF